MNAIHNPTKQQIRKAGECVYFISDPASTFVKVGRTDHLTQRVSSYKWGNAYTDREPKLLAFIQTNDSAELEQEIISALLPHLIAGKEWFAYEPAARYIAALGESQMNTEPYIQRAAKDREHPYVMLNRAAMQNRELTWEARGMLAYLISQPDDWRVQAHDLEQNCGRDRVYRILKELIDAKYIERVESRNERGQHSGIAYFVHESPYPEKPYPEKPEAAKADITYKEDSHKKESTNPTSPVGESDADDIGEATYEDEGAKPGATPKSALCLYLLGIVKGVKHPPKAALKILDRRVVVGGVVSYSDESPDRKWINDPVFRDWVSYVIVPYFQTLGEGGSGGFTHLVNMMAGGYDLGKNNFYKYRTERRRADEEREATERRYQELSKVEGVPIPKDEDDGLTTDQLADRAIKELEELGL